MPAESPELAAARQHLSRAEAGYRTPDGLSHLEEGLALLQDLIDGAAPAQREIARNLASAYASRILGAVGAQLASDRGVPEPELEHLFKVVLAFDEGDFERPAEARSIKIAIARRLIDRYYEGHSAEVKEQALRDLARITDG